MEWRRFVTYLWNDPRNIYTIQILGSSLNNCGREKKQMFNSPAVQNYDHKTWRYQYYYYYYCNYFLHKKEECLSVCLQDNSRSYKTYFRDIS